MLKWQCQETLSLIVIFVTFRVEEHFRRAEIVDKTYLNLQLVRLSSYIAGSPQALLAHFVMRVDIMQRGDGSMVLNEFESFEAYLPSRVSVMEVADAWLHRFWVNQMKAMIP